ncbi:MAG: recombinase RecA [Armatimonadetes bacterium]|nr:recombinase RecA [Armatimonadota bacterium]
MAELYSTGVTFIDEMLGGGVQPGTLVVVRGATGVGKTQLGLSFLNEGLKQEGSRGIALDMASRGDSQQHAEYARRLFDWEMALGEVDPDTIWNGSFRRVDYFANFNYTGKRVVRDNMTDEEWRAWKRVLNEKLSSVVAFYYGHFVHGVRRCVVDGIEPFDKAGDSIQVELFEYLLHKVLRKRHDLVARELFRGKWLEVKEQVAANSYDHEALAAMFLQTTREVDLSDLIAAETQEDDLTTNATTIIVMGRVIDGAKVRRGAFILKNRGGQCPDEIRFFEVTAQGLRAVD